MILALFLGGYLLPRTQYRISDQREYLLYQALCRSKSLDYIDAEMSLINSSIPLTTTQHDFDNKIDMLNDLLKKKSLVKVHDFFTYNQIEENKRKAQEQGLTGDISVDKLLRLHRFLSKYDIIKK